MVTLFTENLLIRHELTRLHHRWWRSVWLWLALFAVAINGWVCLALKMPRGHEPVDDPILYYYFTAFHACLHVLIPVAAVLATRRVVGAGRLEPLLTTPIPSRHIFWWLWVRVFVPALALLLLFYFPLYRPFPWLYAWGDVWTSTATSDHPWLGKCWEGLTDLLALLLFILPWLGCNWKRGRLVRIAIWLLGFTALFLLPILANWHPQSFQFLIMSASHDFLGHTNGRGDDIMPFHTTLACFHPLVTLPYFIGAAGWSVAAGVVAGLRPRLGLASALLLALLLGLAAEGLVLNLYFLSDFPSLYQGFMYLYVMLLFYMSTAGAFWLALKWNLLVWLSRRPLPRQDTGM